MSSDRHESLDIHRSLLASGAVLVGVGGVLVAAGALIGAAAVLMTSRQYVKQMDTPPSEVVRMRLSQAKAAGAAATDAWRNQTSA